MNKIHKLILVSIGASTLGLSGCASEHSKKGLNKTSKDVVLINEQKEIELSHHHQHQEKKSESFFTEQIISNRKRYGNNHSLTIDSIEKLANFYTSDERYGIAEAFYMDALALRKKHQRFPLKIKQSEKKLSQIKEKLVSKNQETSKQEWKRLSSKYTTAYQAGDYPSAQRLAKQALILAEREFGHEHTYTLSSMDNLANLYETQGYFKKAEPFLLEGLALRKKIRGKQHPATLSSMNNLAILYQNQGHYEKAKPLFVESLALSKKVSGKQHPATLAYMNNLALFYEDQRHYEKAEPLYIEVLTIGKKVLGKQHPDRLITMSNLARLYIDQGHYEKAEPLFIKSLTLKKMLGKQHPATLGSMDNLARLYKAQGHFEKAEPLIIEVLTLRKILHGKQHPDTLESMNSLASLYIDQGYYEKAEPLFIEVLVLRKKVLGKQHPNTASSMNNLALLYVAQGHYEKAETLLVEVLVITKKVWGKQHPDMLSSMNNLASLYVAQGHYEKAEQVFVETLALRKKVRGEQHPDTLNSMKYLAVLYHITQQWNKAKTLYDEYLTNSDHYLQNILWGAGEKTRLSYLQQQKGFQNVYLSFYKHLITRDAEKPNHLAQQAWKMSVSRKGLLLRIASEASALSKLHQANDPQLAKLSQQIQQTRSEIAALTFSPQPNPAKQATLDDQLNTLQRQLSSKVSQFRDKTKTIQPENILSALTPQQAVVDFLIYKEVDVNTNRYKTEQLIAFVASQEQGVKFINLGELAPITQLIQNYRGAVEYKPNNPAWFASKERKTYLSKTSQALYKKLWQPLTNALGNKKQIYLIPDGALHLLPFKALQNEHGEDLGQQVALTRLGSARDIVFPQQAVKTNASTIMANPVYSAQVDSKKPKNRTISQTLRDLSFGSLPGTKTESDSIQKTMQQLQQPVNVYTETQASEITIKKEKSPRILHIATHGFFLEKLDIPEDKNLTRGIQFNDRGKMAIAYVENTLARSGLAFTYANQGIKGTKQADGSDGILTALEVIDLNLEGTELVTLSACETGVGEISVGEGVYSLNRAFQEAGAKAVLSTLWKISDEGTNLFMQKFYQQFLNNKSAQQALHETQEAFKNSEEWKDPFYWAAFVMTGE